MCLPFFVVQNVETGRALSEEFRPQIARIHTDSIFGTECADITEQHGLFFTSYCRAHPLRVPKNGNRPQITQISRIYKKGTKHIIPLPCGRNGIGVPLARSVRNSSTDCDDCRFIGTKEHSLESLGLSAQRSLLGVGLLKVLM